jgi:uncharacterized protein
MSQPAKAQEPSMEEILASIRRIIADDDGKPPKPEPVPAKPAAAPPPPPAKSAAPEPAAMSQDDIDAMLSSFDKPAPEPSRPEPEPEPDVFDLTEAMAAPEVDVEEPETPAFRTIGSEPDVMFAEPEPEPEPELEPPPRAAAPPRRTAPLAPHEPPIISAATRASVDAAFNSLAQSVLVHNAMTLEDLVKEMLRPMLKNWLDDNLPNMVERLVRAEIERVSRGR